MKRKKPTNGTRPLSAREAELQAASMPLSLALSFEETGWQSRALRSAFWSGARVPVQHRGDEAPGKPDVRAALSPVPAVVTEFNRAWDTWQEEQTKWSRARLRWLTTAAQREK